MAPIDPEMVEKLTAAVSALVARNLNFDDVNAVFDLYEHVLKIVGGTMVVGGFAAGFAYRTALLTAIRRIWKGEKKNQQADDDLVGTALGELPPQHAAAISNILELQSHNNKHPHIAQGAQNLLNSINRSREASPASSKGGEGQSNTGPQPSGRSDKARGRPPGPKKSDGGEPKGPELRISRATTDSSESDEVQPPRLLTAPGRDRSPAASPEKKGKGVAQKPEGKKAGRVVPVEAGKSVKK